MNLSLAVRKNYGHFTLAADINVTGDRVGIFGASGSGKSTLVGILAGLMKPDSGEIVLDGDCLFNSAKKINVPPQLRRISIVFQQHSLFPHMNVRQNLLYGFKRTPHEYRKICFDELVTVLELEKLLESGVNILSGGEKQRVTLGRGILANPRLLLMDEPLSALDDSLRFQIIPYLKSVSERFGIPYLFISHSLVEMRLMTDSAIVIENGLVSKQTQSDQLARIYMGESCAGYINLLELHSMKERNGLCAYSWEGGELLLSHGNRDAESGLFELSSKDIILFKQHPEAISARNLLECTVISVFESNSKTGVELAAGSGRLVAEVVKDAANELDIMPGARLFAAVKASAFRRLSKKDKIPAKD